jgi:hypothetical protein
VYSTFLWQFVHACSALSTADIILQQLCRNGMLEYLYPSNETAAV